MKNNARLFYDSEFSRLTAKVALKSHSRSGSLAREIKSRKFYADIDAVPIPKLFRYDTSRLSWLEEEFIEGDNTISADQKKELFLVAHAKQMYAPWARSRPVSNSLHRLGVSWADVRSVLSEAGIVMPPALQSANWPISLLHGDLTAENMIVQKGRLFIVDWERFGIGPVAWDLRKLFRRNQTLVCNLLASLNGLNDLAPITQILLIMAAHLVLIRRQPKRLREQQSRRETIVLKSIEHCGRLSKIDASQQLERASKGCH